MFMVVLDVAVVNVALPSLQVAFGVGQTALQWVVIAYGLMLGGFLLVGGRAADLLGQRKMLVAGLGLFTVSSLAAGLSGSLGELVASRFAQGLGAAMATPAALSLLTNTFPEGPARNKALGIFGAAGGTAAGLGSIVGGALTSGPGWAWIFLLNVPIGAALIGLVLIHIPPIDPVAGRRPDLPGALTLTAGLLAIVFAISKSADNGWTSPTTLGLLGAGTALLVLFAIVERRSATPLVPLSIFRRKTFTTTTVLAALVWGCFFALIFQVTFFLQQALRYSPLQTGVATLVIAGVSLIAAAVVGPRIADRLGASVVLAIGQTSSVIGLLLLAQAPVNAEYATDLLPAFVMLGIGIGFSELGTQIAAFIGIEEAIAGLAGGVVETSREIGAVLGTAIVASIVITRINHVRSSVAHSATGKALALTDGFHRGVLFLAAGTAIGAVISLLVLRRAERAAAIQASATTIRPPVPNEPLAASGRHSIRTSGHPVHANPTPSKAQS
jgi:EmrB/QacA subfamily drug resistance transporter